VPEPPIHLTLEEDQQRNRLTVFFRLLLALPHFVWLFGWSVLAGLGAVLNWLITLVRGTSPAWLHGFLARYLRYATHVSAFASLTANPFPGFAGAPGYPVDLEIAPPQKQNRWTVAFRAILALPALLLDATLTQAGGGRNSFSLSVLVVCGTLAWFVSLIRARTSRGLRDAAAFALAYSAQAHGYLLLLTDRYPSSDPLTLLPAAPERADPIAIEVADDLRRSRLTVFFRLLLVLPHLVWLFLWDVVAFLAALVNSVVTIIKGISPEPLHRFLAAYLRQRLHVSAYLWLLANPFPGFVGRAGSYPVDLRIAAPERQNRWSVFFRWLLGIPALLLAITFGALGGVVAVLGWFASLFTGRMPLGLRNAGALALRYGAQTHGYLYMLTPSYPYSGPTRQDGPRPAPGEAPPGSPAQAPFVAPEGGLPGGA
jgi:Domain of unknown function (DUF4389)